MCFYMMCISCLYVSYMVFCFQKKQEHRNQSFVFVFAVRSHLQVVFCFSIDSFLIFAWWPPEDGPSPRGGHQANIYTFKKKKSNVSRKANTTQHGEENTRQKNTIDRMFDVLDFSLFAGWGNLLAC